MTNLRKILFLSEGQLGDCLILTPALRAIKETYPKVHVSVLIMYRRSYAYFWNGSYENSLYNAYIRPSSFKGTAEVFRDNPYVDSVFEMNRGAIRKLKGIRRIKAEIRNILTLREQKFDVVVCNFPEDRFSIYAFLSGAKLRIGERPSSFGFLLNRKENVNQEDNGVLEYFISLLSPLNVKATLKDLYFRVSDEFTKEAAGYLRKMGFNGSDVIIGIHPGSSQNDRKWLPEKFSSLIESLKERSKVIILYSDYDQEFVNEIRKHLKSDVLTIKTESISMLAAFIKHCRFCITHSSGPRHLAVALGVPVIGLFDKTDDIRWGIYDSNKFPVIKTRKECPVCPRNKCLGIIPEGRYSSYCMRKIELEEVICKANEFISRFKKSSGDY